MCSKVLISVKGLDIYLWTNYFNEDLTHHLPCNKLSNHVERRQVLQCLPRGPNMRPLHGRGITWAIQCSKAKHQVMKKIGDLLAYLLKASWQSVPSLGGERLGAVNQLDDSI